MPRPRKNAGWSLAKKTFLKKKKKRTPPPRASSDDDSDDEAFARRLAAARAAREQQRHPDASSSSDDEAWQDARRRAGAAPADASPPPARGPPARARLAAAGPTTWAEAEPLDRDWGRGEGVGDGGLLWDDDAEGPAADDPLGLGLRGGGPAAADFDACAYVRDVCGDAAFGELRAGRRALGGRLGEEERRRRGAVRGKDLQRTSARGRAPRALRARPRAPRRAGRPRGTRRAVGDRRDGAPARRAALRSAHVNLT